MTLRVAAVRGSGVPIPWVPPTPCLVCLSAACLGSGLFYLTLRTELRIAAPLLGLGMELAGLIGSGEASDLAFYFGRNRPFVDDALSAADHAIGFCWRCTALWWDAHPLLFAIGDGAYRSFLAQATLIVLALAVQKQPFRLCVLVIGCQLALVFTTLIAYRFPALGAYTHYGLVAADHRHITPVFSDDMRNTVAWLRTADFSGFPDGLTTGLISFPSFHAVLAIAYTWGAWPTLCRWPIVALNLATVAVTPIDGSHYLIDLIIGLGVGVLALATAAALLDSLARRRTSPIRGQQHCPAQPEPAGLNQPVPGS